jgi:hypothetical protein
MLLLAGELGLLVFVVAVGALWWAAPHLLHRRRRRPPRALPRGRIPTGGREG